MKVSSVLFLANLASAGLVRRQTGPVDPSTDPDCDFYDTANSASDNCQHFEDFWGISHADFVAWNPSVKDDCSGIKVGNSYCVEVVRKPKSSSTVATSTTSSSSPKPSPTQDGLISSCINFYEAVKGDNCDKIVKKYNGTFSQADFLTWNPAVESDCSGLFADTWYCVGIPGTPTAPVSTSGASPTASGSGKPSPTQDGLISSCVNFYEAVKGDNCPSRTSPSTW